MTTPLSEQELESAIQELKECTVATMETVGIRCARRVNTTLFKQGLAHLDGGKVVVQPPSEDRVSIFMSLTGGKQASLKIFSTGKVRCLKSDFSSLEHAQGCAQAVIDRMAGINNSGMPPIRLHDAKLHLNGKDYTWSSRLSTDMRKLSKALDEAGIRSESDNSFGDSVMVIISPAGSDRRVKGQVLADGTIRLAGCRGDGEATAQAVVQSLNATGCLQGPDIDLTRLRCEVWLTKRRFHVCGEDRVLDMDALHTLLTAGLPREGVHPTLLGWAGARRHAEFVLSAKRVGTACPRLEVKFLPVTIAEWEVVPRKPEPISITIHHRGEVEMAGNAEYKVLQAYWFVKHLVAHRLAALVRPARPGPREPAPTRPRAAPKRRLEVCAAPAAPGAASKRARADPAPAAAASPAGSWSSSAGEEGSSPRSTSSSGSGGWSYDPRPSHWHECWQVAAGQCEWPAECGARFWPPPPPHWPHAAPLGAMTAASAICGLSSGGGGGNSGAAFHAQQVALLAVLRQHSRLFAPSAAASSPPAAAASTPQRPGAPEAAVQPPPQAATPRAAAAPATPCTAPLVRAGGRDWRGLCASPEASPPRLGRAATPPSAKRHLAPAARGTAASPGKRPSPVKLALALGAVAAGAGPSRAHVTTARMVSAM